MKHHWCGAAVAAGGACGDIRQRIGMVHWCGWGQESWNKLCADTLSLISLETDVHRKHEFERSFSEASRKQNYDTCVYIITICLVFQLCTVECARAQPRPVHIFRSIRLATFPGIGQGGWLGCPAQAGTLHLWRVGICKCFVFVSFSFSFLFPPVTVDSNILLLLIIASSVVKY